MKPESKMSDLKAAAAKVKITPEEVAPLQGYNPDQHIADPAKDIMDAICKNIDSG